MQAAQRPQMLIDWKIMADVGNGCGRMKRLQSLTGPIRCRASSHQAKSRNGLVQQDNFNSSDVSFVA
jgi:hypothetical protein